MGVNGFLGKITCILNIWLFLLPNYTEYDKLARLAAPLPGSTSSLLPPVFLRTILFLEETLASTSTSAGGKKAKMNATAAKALTAVKQKVKKATRDNEGILTEYKEVRSQHIQLPHQRRPKLF